MIGRLVYIIEIIVFFLACILVFAYGAPLLLMPFAILFSVTLVLFAYVPFLKSENRYKISFPSFVFAFPLMVATLVLIVPALGQPVIPNSQIPILSLFRTVTWIPLSLFAPGIFVLSTIGLDRMICFHEKLALAVSISIAFLGLSTSLVKTVAPVAQNIIPVIILSEGTYVVVSKLVKKKRIEVQFTREGVFVALLLLSVLAASATIQVAQGYLVGGDLWRNARIALYLDTRSDALALFENPETIGLYPTFIGYIIVALSQLSGLPIVNAYVMSFAVVVINGLTLYCVFDRLANDKKIALLGAFFASVGGGFGWVVAISRGLMPEIWEFWISSYISQDMYFSQSITANLLQNATAVGLSLALSALLALLISIKTADKKRSFSLLAISGLLLASSLLTHMVEFLFVAILIFILCAFSQRLKEGLTCFLACAIFVVAFEVLNGFYEIRYGFSRVLQWFPTMTIPIVTVGMVVSILFLSGAAIVRKMNKFPTIFRLRIHADTKVRFSAVYPFLCFLVWLLFVVLWANSRLPDPAYAIGVGYPIWLYSIAFGFIGLLGLVGLRRLDLHDGTSQSILVWMLTVFIIATFVWGQRAATFLFLPLSFFASLEIVCWSDFVNAASSRVEKSIRGICNQAVVSGLVLLVLLSSSVSFAFTVRYFSREPAASDNIVVIAKWIFENTPQNASVFATLSHKDFIATITLRPTFPRSEPSRELEASIADYGRLIQSPSSIQVTSIINKWDITYAIIDEGELETWPAKSYFRHLLNTSQVLVASETVKLLQLPR